MEWMKQGKNNLIKATNSRGPHNKHSDWFFPNFSYKNLGALTPVLHLPNVVATGSLPLARNLSQIEDDYFNPPFYALKFKL